MRIVLYLMGKTSMPYVNDGMDVYSRRLLKYVKLEVKVFAPVRNAASLLPAEVKVREAEIILKSMTGNAYNVLLDEKGRMMDSRTFAGFIQQRMNLSTAQLGFYVGGAWGFDDSVRARANDIISLSQMTFSHQLIRIIFLEQLYRAFSIIRNEPYHND